MSTQIALKNPEDMFNIMGAGIYLNFENPGPVTVDLKSLSNEDYDAIVKGIMYGRIVSDKGLAEMNNEFSPVPNTLKAVTKKEEKALSPEQVMQTVLKEKVTPAPIKKVTPIIETVVENAEELRKKLVKILSKKRVDLILKKVSKENNNARELKLLIEIEERGRKRGKLLTELNSLLKIQESAIIKNIGLDPGLGDKETKKMMKQFEEIESKIVREEDTEVVVKLEGARVNS